MTEQTSFRGSRPSFWQEQAADAHRAAEHESNPYMFDFYSRMRANHAVSAMERIGVTAEDQIYS